MNHIPILTHVALVEDLPEHRLTRGQLGTVVEYLGDDNEPVLLVEFSSAGGETYAMAAVRPDQLIALHRKSEAA